MIVRCGLRGTKFGSFACAYIGVCMCVVGACKCLRHLDSSSWNSAWLFCLLGLTLGLVWLGLGSLKLGRLALWAFTLSFVLSCSPGLSQALGFQTLFILLLLLRFHLAIGLRFA